MLFANSDTCPLADGTTNVRLARQFAAIFRAAFFRPDLCLTRRQVFLRLALFFLIKNACRFVDYFLQNRKKKILLNVSLRGPI
jgi:hypothetical protein